jgi:hypothetical protein
MEFLVNQLMQYKGSHDGEYSCLQKSIARLNRRIGWVPQGWVPLYQEMVKSLLSLNDAAHGYSTVVGPWVEDEKMVFTSKNLTPVVAGILRKTMQRSLCTCKSCGLPGKPRNFGDENVEVLCARCYAPREISMQLDTWIPRLESEEFLETESVVVIDDLEPAFLALIPSSQWRWVQNGADGEALPYVLAKDLAKQLPEFRDLHTLVMMMAAVDE